MADDNRSGTDRQAGYVLTVRRNGRLLAEWSLDQGPLELTVVDRPTGKVTSTFMATPPVEPGELRDDMGRADGDDITLPLPESSPALSRVERQSDTSDPILDIPPAEVWVRKSGEWRSAGELRPKQRVTTLDGWVRHSRDGRLVVCSGPRMSGSATLPDGRTLEVAVGQDALSLPAGSTVLLGDGDHGLYVRSEVHAATASEPLLEYIRPRGSLYAEQSDLDTF